MEIILQNTLFLLSIVDSTNQYLIDRIFCLKSGDVCIAEYQTQGRGRFGRRWLSFFGNNLYLSIYWYISRKRVFNVGLSLMVAIVTAELLQQLGVHEVRIKWPNDIYLRNRKLAGILVEIIDKINSDFVHVIIGIGINLSRFGEVCRSINYYWINLQDVGIVINRDMLIIQLINLLTKALQQFDYYGFESFFVRWFDLDIFYNKFVGLSNGNKVMKGVSRGINQQGAILLEISGKIRSYFNGDIFLFK